MLLFGFHPRCHGKVYCVLWASTDSWDLQALHRWHLLAIWIQGTIVKAVALCP